MYRYIKQNTKNEFSLCEVIGERNLPCFESTMHINGHWVVVNRVKKRVIFYYITTPGSTTVVHLLTTKK